MDIIEPTYITTDNLDSSTLVEDDYDEWSSGTTYAVDEYCIILATSRVYLCRVAHTDKPPAINLYDEDEVTGYWTDYSTTNKWKMFDLKSKSNSVSDDPITVEITPGILFNAIGLVNVLADSITIVIDDPIEGEVYNVTHSMLDLTGIDNHYDWYFQPISNKDSLVDLELPAYTSATITITIDNGPDPVSVGELVIGRVKYLGSEAYGCEVSAEDYSIKDVEEITGVADIEEGAWAKTVIYEMGLYANRVYDIQRTLEKYRATPILYIGDSSQPELTVFAFLKEFTITPLSMTWAECTLEVEELVA